MTAAACEVRPAVDPSQFVTAVMMIEADGVDPYGRGFSKLRRERDAWLRAQPRPGRGLRCRLGRHAWAPWIDVNGGWLATYCTRYCGAHKTFMWQLGRRECDGVGDDRECVLEGMHWMARIPGYVTQWQEWLAYHDLRKALALVRP